MKISGLKDLLPFLGALKDNNILYRIEHLRDDSIMVTFSQLYFRVEVDFFEDHVEYSYFVGDEAVLDDQELLSAFMNHDHARLAELGVKGGKRAG